MELRPYQAELERAIQQVWAGGTSNALAVLPTGGGKTVLFSYIKHHHAGHSIAIAHRQELVEQISLALAREGLKHQIIAPQPVVKQCIARHMQELGHTLYDPRATTAVAGVDTLLRRKNIDWAKFTLWVMDEAHHVLTDNKWGKAVALMPHAKGLGVTATPVRADGRGLGNGRPDNGGIPDPLQSFCPSGHRT